MGKLKKLHSLKEGTKFLHFGKDNVQFICTAKAKHGKEREISIEGMPSTYSFHSDTVVELVSDSIK